MLTNRGGTGHYSMEIHITETQINIRYISLSYLLSSDSKFVCSYLNKFRFKARLYSLVHVSIYILSHAKTGHIYIIDLLNREIVHNQVFK